MKVMPTIKVLSSMLALGFSLSAHAANALPVYHCEYRIAQDGKFFTMNGDIDATGADTTPGGSTYLTLEPNKSSGIDVTARVLITHWDNKDSQYYNPMTLHRRGDSGAVLASALLTGKEQLLTYEDIEANATYSLLCKVKPK